MKEKLNQFMEQIKLFWNKTSIFKRVLYISMTILLIVGIVVITVVTNKSSFIPLYSNLSIQEVGQIKEELDTRNIQYEIVDNGTTIKVPEEYSQTLIVELANEGIPNSGNIDYSFFSENSSWGITDNEFNIMKLDAMQTELSNLMKGMEGIEDANVMINLPEQSVFVSDMTENASVSIVLQTEYGYEFQPNQMKGLYHLVSKAIPNLPEENIVIMNQNFEYFDQYASNQADHIGATQDVKTEIENDIQKRVQQMLSAIVGADKVITSVTADIDFTNENRIEDLVEPVDIDTMEGIPVSIETIQETFEGTDEIGGVAGTGEEDIANYPGVMQGEGGDYDLAKETVNYEFNNIKKEIAEAPYKIRDLGIQVMVDNTRVVDGEVVELTQQELNAVEEGMASILESMITTSIDKTYGEIETDDKISIVFQTFHGRDQLTADMSEKSSFPIWPYIIGAIIIITIIIIFFVMRRKRTEDIVEKNVTVSDITTEDSVVIPDIEEQPKREQDIQKEQLEKMAKDKPEDFAKLLRSWISED